MDRNLCVVSLNYKEVLSLSARRAWIEIAAVRLAVLAYYVALRKESVDRNSVSTVVGVLATLVALRKESVDRNRYHCDDVSD